MSTTLLPKNRRNIQSENGSGHYGDTFEAGLKSVFGQLALVSRGRAFDLILDKKRYEIKTGSGELGRTGSKPCAGVSFVIYCPVYNENVAIYQQEAFVLKRDNFLKAIETAGLMRYGKATTNGTNTVNAIQTFWNRSKNAPHGKGYYRLLDALYDNMECTLEDFIYEMI